MKAEEEGRILLPPDRILTAGALPEELYEPPRPLAGGALARRAWAEGLGRMEEQVREVVFGSPEEAEGAAGSLARARVLDSLNRTVGAAGLTFRDVAAECRRGFLFSDEDRWKALSLIQDAALGIMKSAGRMDREEARRLALRDGEIQTTKRVVLVGVVETPLVLRRMLESVEDRILALVHAPETEADAFHRLGFLENERWKDREVPVADHHLAVCDRPVDQAREVVRYLAALPGEPTLASVTVGVPDATLAPYLAQRLEAHGQPARYADGTPLASSPPYRLLEALAPYLEDGRFPAFAALMRHPDLPDGLGPESSPDLSDRHFRDHVPSRLDPESRNLTGGGTDDRFSSLLEGLHSPALLGAFSGIRPLSAWMPVILDFLAGVYGSRYPDPSRGPDRILVEAASRIRDAASELAELPSKLDLECGAGRALRTLLGEVRDLRIPPAAEEEALELVGWLELHLDDAPTLVLTGAADPFLPEAVTAHPFLPNALRARLGLQDNRSRYARDAYWMTAMIHSRENVRVIAGRRTTVGDPLRPSRLLLTGSTKVKARRILLLTRPEAEGVGPGRDTVPGLRLAETSGFHLPPQSRLPLLPPPQPFPVTAFSGLLANPYAWILESLMGLEDQADDAQELDPGTFGVLAHDVLERFGRSGLRDSSDEDEIFPGLSRLLDELAEARFGPTPLPTVPLQVEQLRYRLKAFARWQAKWREEGWTIHAVEARTPEEGIPFDVDGKPFFLSGRIDRIDRHRESGAWMVFDYKTGDAGGDPSGCTKNGEWTDLQLPLYRHLIRGGLRSIEGGEITPPGEGVPLRLAYLPLSKDAHELEEAEADWAEALLEGADERAREVVRWMRTTREVPFEAGRPVSRFGSSLASLLGEGLLQSEGEDE